MRKKFNITGSCNPRRHYMVDITKKLKQIERLIEDEEYFTINRARQYGKTTTLKALTTRLKDRYLVLSISFESIADRYYENEENFSNVFIKKIVESMKRQKIDKNLIEFWKDTSSIDSFYELSLRIEDFCIESGKEVVLLIDEVDKSGDNRIFLSFLGMLRERYLDRDDGVVTFKSVVLAGVYDVKNLKLKLRPEEEGKYNSPWNIAAKFKVDMSFSIEEIEDMLNYYKSDKNLDFDTNKVADTIHDYTNGYPFLVSAICKCVDEELCEEYEYKSLNEAWSNEGVLFAIKCVEETKNLLFDDINKQLDEYNELNGLIKDILLEGNEYEYIIGNQIIEKGEMFGLLANIKGMAEISNRIFEVYLYNKYISENNANEF